jgi:3-hydroxyacyl-CoA dehydrogenase
MGQLELVDFTGLDICPSIMQVLHQQLIEAQNRDKRSQEP